MPIWYPCAVRPLVYLLSTILMALLFLGGPNGLPYRSFGELWNLGHVLAFALWSALLLASARAARWPLRRQAGIVFAFALLFGLLSEGLQVWFARSPDVADLARDLLGGGLALAFFAPGRNALPPLRRRLLQGATLAGLAVAAVPLLWAGTDDFRGRLHFPVLSDFESALETGRWQEGRGRISRATDVAFHGRASLRVDLTTDSYSGTMLKYFPGDWRGYRRLRFEAFNPGPAPLVIHVRIHDRHHEKSGGAYRDRFNATRTLAPGWNPVVIELADVEKAPRGRAMDMARLERIGVFVADLPEPRSLYLDHVRLEK